MENKGITREILWHVLRSLRDDSCMFFHIHTAKELFSLDEEFRKTHNDPLEWQTEILWRGGTIVVYDILTPRNRPSIGYLPKTWNEEIASWRYVVDLERINYVYQQAGGEPPVVCECAYYGRSFALFACNLMQIALFNRIEYIQIKEGVWKRK